MLRGDKNMYVPTGNHLPLPLLIFAAEAPLRSLRELCRLSFFLGVFGGVAVDILGRIHFLEIFIHIMNVIKRKTQTETAALNIKMSKTESLQIGILE